MKINYYKYYLTNESKKYHVDMTPVLKCFLKAKDETLYSSFQFKDENLFLFHVVPPVYMFVVTKSSEIIKAIHKGGLSQDDIYKKLNTDERLGFAAYINFSEYFYGIGSTLHGPKNDAFVTFLNGILNRWKFNGWEFVSVAIATEATTRQVLKMPFIGKTKLEVSPKHTLGKTIMGFLTLEESEIDGIEIEVKPKKREKINKSFKGISKSVPIDSELRKYIVRAKSDLESSLTDYYLVGSGYLCDTIQTKDEKRICDAIKKKIMKNQDLHEVIHEHQNDTSIISM
ncbi:MAG: hypothetical protein JEZ02_17235, partial [Desulfatibacillum sp.]|nr:hypothetical protein [Desulfatibacillum sp.]